MRVTTCTIILAAYDVVIAGDGNTSSKAAPILVFRVVDIGFDLRRKGRIQDHSGADPFPLKKRSRGTRPLSIAVTVACLVLGIGIRIVGRGVGSFLPVQQVLQTARLPNDRLPPGRIVGRSTATIPFLRKSNLVPCVIVIVLLGPKGTSIHQRRKDILPARK